MKQASGVLMGGVLLMLAAGCGPTITEMRMSYLPPRPADCSLKVVQTGIEELAPGTGAWEVVGHIMLQETGIHDPFEERYLKIVRPRACAMGGDALTILQAATSSNAMGSGSGVQYAVLRARAAPPPPPAAKPDSV